MDSSTTRPEKLFAVHLPSARSWMAISSKEVARALEETYEVVEFEVSNIQPSLYGLTSNRGALRAAIHAFGPIAEGREAGMQRALRAFVGFAEGKGIARAERAQREELLKQARAHLRIDSDLSLRVRRRALAEFLGVEESELGAPDA